MSHNESLLPAHVGQVAQKTPGWSEMAFLFSFIADAWTFQSDTFAACRRLEILAFSLVGALPCMGAQKDRSTARKSRNFRLVRRGRSRQQATCATESGAEMSPCVSVGS